MKTLLFPILASASLLLLSACGEEVEVPEESDASATATGDVLGGSISDAMLPLGELRSQSPAAPRRVTAPASAGSEQSEPVAETPEAEAAPAAPAPETAPPPPPAE